MQMRINKFIAQSGHVSRRKADKLVENGFVTINGIRASLGDLVDEDDEVKVNGKKIGLVKQMVYYKYHKAKGIICTSNIDLPDNIISAASISEKVFPVGRLDVSSSGLIFLTNDGEFANKIMHPKFEHEKEYEVKVDKKITKDFIISMKTGVFLLGVKTLPAKVFLKSNNVFRIILKQGLNRQIRRMCEELGYSVSTLKRVRIINITISGLLEGKAKKIKGSELKELLQTIGMDVIK